MSDERCKAEGRAKRQYVNHTFRCQLPEGHEGLHHHTDGFRKAYWPGEPTKQEDSTRHRWGIRYEG